MERKIKCPISKFTSLLGGKWKILILYQLYKNENDKMRFGQIASKLPISKKVLTEQLKQLSNDKLILRKQFEVIPPKVEYSLSKKSQNLLDSNFFREIEEWVLNNFIE
tara:strand:+ start:410 stop:733 length:324 start_codon:yes stop_codon:yes gene_type:complete